MKKIFATKKGNKLSVLIDDKYYKEISKHNWYVDDWGYCRKNYILSSKKLGTVFLHSFIWFLETGKVIVSDNKSLSIDHINRDTLDNQISNLRVVNQKLQKLNRKSNNKTGYKGVYFRPEKKSKQYQCMICINRKAKSLGYFNTAQEAYNVFKEAYKNLHGFYPV